MKDFLVEWCFRSDGDFVQVFQACDISRALNQAILFAQSKSEDEFPDFYPTSIEEI